jgi:tetratricopeptide (TPR) repeat protein
MAEQFLRRYAEAHGARPNRLSRAAEAWLVSYRWPGDVRELSHLLERVTLLRREAIVSPSTLEALCLPQPSSPVAVESMAGADASGEIEERTQIQAVLRQTRVNVVQAARLLGLSRGALRHRLRRYGLQSPRARAPLPAPSGEQLVTRLPERSGAEHTPERPIVPSPMWEHKPVAVLAIELTFPTATAVEAAAYEPWTAASRWEQALVAKVQGFGGIVLQRSPSLLLVAFGIPRTLEQLPQRAVQAALALRQLTAERAGQAPCPALRLVVHWGEVLMDVQASDPTAQLRAIGETLAWPVRLLGQAAPGDILLSPELGPLVEGWCEVQAREVSLQGGPPGRIMVYAVVGNRPRWSRLEMHRWRPLSPFIGRDQELATLCDRLRQVEAGQGQVVAVIGEPGIGKSRLCYEFIRGVLTSPSVVLETQGTPYGKAIPYLPIIDLLKGYFRLDDRDAPPTVRDKVTATLRGLDDTLTPTAPAILTLLDVPVEDADWRAIEAPQRRQRTLDAIKRLLVWGSQGHPLLLVVENLHWIDTETQAVLDTLIDSGDFGRAAELQRWNVEATERESGTSSLGLRSRYRARLAQTLGELGAFAEGRCHGEEALRLAMLEGRVYTLTIVHGCLGSLYLAQGDLEHAIRVYDRGLALCRASGNRTWLRVITASLGYTSALEGRLVEGRPLLEEAISESIRTGARQSPRWVAWLSEVCRLAGRYEEAWQRARQALDLARQHKERANEAHALFQLAAVHAHGSPPDVRQAEARCREALTLAEALGTRPLRAHCHRGLGTLYATVGRQEQARAGLATAIELYRSMEMTFWLPQTEAALALISG